MQGCISDSGLVAELGISTCKSSRHYHRSIRMHTPILLLICRFLNSGRYSGVGEDRNRRQEKVLEKAVNDACSDKFFKAFRKRVALEPEQACIRIYSCSLVMCGI